MYKILAISVIIICSTTLFGQKKKIAAEDKIKSVVVYEEKYEKGGNSKTLKDSETKYDVYGNVIEETEYKNGAIDKHIKYQYDSRNNKIKEIELDQMDKPIKTIEYKYDSNNNKIKESEQDASGKVVKISEYRYDKNRKSEKLVYNGNQKLKQKKTYKYETY